MNRFKFSNYKLPNMAPFNNNKAESPKIKNPKTAQEESLEKAKEAFYQMLDMDPHKRFVNHDSKSNYDIHTIFREIEKFAQNPSDMSVINFNRYKRLPDFWQWGRN